MTLLCACRRRARSNISICVPVSHCFTMYCKLGAVKAGNIFVRMAHLQLMKNVMAHSLRGAGGEGRDRAIRKMWCAARLTDDSRGETHVPIQRCSALRLWQRKIQEYFLAN